MSETHFNHLARYLHHSERGEFDGESGLQLATARQGDSYPYFFEGVVLQPRATAMMLYALSTVVGSRFYTPPAMLKRIIAESDPVITSGGGYLRLEGFSACCSTYARVDLSPDAYKGKIVGQGTTNVDFNAALKATLLSTRDTDRMALAVGSSEVVLRRNFNSVIEKKVDLPVRWLKGFVEVQSYQSGMEHAFTISKVETQNFIRSLPKNARPESKFWVVQTGKGLRLSQTRSDEAVNVGGLNRLNLLRDISPLCDQLTVYKSKNGQASEWHLTADGLSFCLTITAEVNRGFSGEGQVLDSLVANIDEHAAKLKSLLKWQSAINLADSSRQLQITPEILQVTMATLGSQGYVGYDRNLSAYYHRELPYRLDALQEMHPRLKAARKLVDSNGVKILTTTREKVEATVKGTDVDHLVRLDGDKVFCTCPWYSKNQGDRGPCKHILAVKINNEKSNN